MKDFTDKMKWVYTFALLVLTLAWAVFLALFVYHAMTSGPEPVDVVAGAGIGVLLGALIAWNGNVNQHWFRKKVPEENEPTEPTA